MITESGYMILSTVYYSLFRLKDEPLAPSGITGIYFILY